MLKTNKLKTLIMSVVFSLISIQAAQAATYTVSSGDTLYSIGRLFNTSAAVIKENNSLGSNTIYPGQKLTIQAAQYTVKSGDTLYSIANRYGVTLYSLRKASNEWDNSIYPGQILVIPAAGIAPAPSAPVQQTVIPYTASDLDLMARLIRAEAEGQPYTAKVAVGAVVVNRVKSSLFPNTISGVIYHRANGYYQFTPVLNGMINRSATQEDINAAREALHGSDPTRGALFYFDDSATNQWLWSKPVALRVGRMIFSY